MDEQMSVLHVEIIGRDGNSKKFPLKFRMSLCQLPNKMQGFIPSKARLYL